MEALDRIRQQVQENPIVIYMKGTPQFPQCGFSGRAAQALMASGVDFAYVNIFDDEEVYRALPQFGNWPTFPQLYVNGELVGGCDIVVELYEQGELPKILQQAAEQHGSESGQASETGASTHN